MDYIESRTRGCLSCLSTGLKGGRLLRTPFLLVAIGILSQGCSLGQKKFSAPEDATRALVVAARSENNEEVLCILGRGAEDIVSSGDDVADRQAREKFLKAYDEKNALVSEPDGSMTLQVGQDDWPLPIPLVERWGSWRFDTRRGKDEILNRRIGRNELAVRQVCLALVDAQREYVALDRNGDGVPEYAQKLLSDPGQKNGLYWETRDNGPPSPMGPLVAEAAAEGYSGTRDGQPRPYHGYYFKLLKAQGPNAPGGAREFLVNGRMIEGFAVVAWPAEYRNSGVMTFLVSHQGIVYEQNLGTRTERIASSMTAFDPDSEWSAE